MSQSKIEPENFETIEDLRDNFEQEFSMYEK